MYKFFVNNNQIDDGVIKIIGEDYNHIVNVLRMKNGDEILVSNKQTYETYNCKITKITENEVVCIINNKLEDSSELVVEVDLYQGLPKADKFEFIIQKAVELGVHQITPVNMKYCIAKIKDEEKKNARWNKISEVASKQSKRDIIPKITFSMDFKNLDNILKDYDLVVVAYENEDKTSIRKILESNKKARKIALIIGPEGGLSKEEINHLDEIGAKTVTLGKRILRTETAPIAALSMIIYEYELN